MSCVVPGIELYLGAFQLVKSCFHNSLLRDCYEHIVMLKSTFSSLIVRTGGLIPHSDLNYLTLNIKNVHMYKKKHNIK